MALLRLPTVSSLSKACSLALDTLSQKRFFKEQRFSIKVPFTMPFEPSLLLSVKGIRRSFYQSPYTKQAYYGLGTAVVFLGSDSVREAVQKKDWLIDNQHFFSARRFDEASRTDEEWQGFSPEITFLPLLSIVCGNESCALWLNYFPDKTFEAFYDQAFMLLTALLHHEENNDVSSTLIIEKDTICPRKEVYGEKLLEILAEISLAPAQRKVVIGRRHEFLVSPSLDPWRLFLKVRADNQDAHLFFMDNGEGDCFFGASPEILFTLNNDELTTVAVAGTRAVLHQKHHELLESVKDNHEHNIVADFLLAKLTPLAFTDITISPLDILTTSCVQHLRRTLRLRLKPNIDEHELLKTLHPTPAVCGYEPLWAKEYIRHNEGFDRGYFAGPIGIIGKNYSEMAVGIRSALFRNNTIYVYAASGIVEGSRLDEEWREMENKERTILKPLGL